MYEYFEEGVVLQKFLNKFNFITKVYLYENSQIYHFDLTVVSIKVLQY